MHTPTKMTSVVWVCFLIFFIEFTTGGWEHVYGYSQISAGYVEELGGVAYALNHEASGATVVYMDCKDTEKTFGIGFQTIARDDTGVNHIIEHCLLSDSFSYWANHTGASYLNAMTFSDFTLYALAAQDENEYRRLITAYMDGIFYPEALSSPETFMKEGWRTEFRGDGTSYYNGTVLNEMRGAYANDLAYLDRSVLQSLFPNTQYRFDSGGFPSEIPKLAYEDFVMAFKMNYRPSNAMIFLYGDQDISATLKMLDENYLSRFPGVKNREELPREAIGGSEEKAVCTAAQYPNNGETKASMAISYAVCGCTEEDYYSLEILAELLSRSFDGLAGNARCELSNMMNQCVFSVVLEGINPDKAEETSAVVRERIEKISRKGISREQIAGVKNRYEFGLAMNKNKPRRGITANIHAMASFVYGDETNPLAGLFAESDMEKAAERFDNSTVKKLARQYLVENNHSSVVLIKPGDPDNSSVMTLLQMDGGNSTKEIPPVEILPGPGYSELFFKPPAYSTERIGSLRLIHTELDTHGISSLHLMTDASMLPMELIPYAQVLSGLMGSLSSIPDASAKYVGSLNSYVGVDYIYGDSENYTPRFHLEIQALDRNMKNALAAVSAHMNPDSSLPVDREKLRLYLTQAKYAMEGDYENRMPLTDCLARLNNGGRYGYEVNGYGYYAFVCRMLSGINDDASWAAIATNLMTTKELLLNQAMSVISFTGSKAAYESCKEKLPDLVSGWGKVYYSPVEYDFTRLPEGRSYPSRYSPTGAAVSGGLYEPEETDTGAMLMAGSMIDANYLWPKVRDEGGAYGVGVSVLSNGSFLMRSYRDPDPEATLDIFSSVPEYLSAAAAADIEKDFDGLKRHVLSQWDEQFRPYKLWDYGAKAELGIIDPAAMAEIRKQIRYAMPWDIIYDAQAWEPTTRIPFDRQ